jgi:cytochrome P450
LSWLSANHDEGAFDDPDTVRIDRASTRHAAFGWGIHRCIGAELARMMFEVMLGEVLARIPDYRVDTPSFQTYAAPQMAGIVALPVRFTPGDPVGDGQRPF